MTTFQADIEKVEKAIDDFVENNVSCASCQFWEKHLWGGECCASEYPIGYLKDDTNMCEQHEFEDVELEKQLEKLQDIWYNLLVAEGLLPTE